VDGNKCWVKISLHATLKSWLILVAATVAHNNRLQKYYTGRSCRFHLAPASDTQRYLGANIIVCCSRYQGAEHNPRGWNLSTVYINTIFSKAQLRVLKSYIRGSSPVIIFAVANSSLNISTKKQQNLLILHQAVVVLVTYSLVVTVN
jgi:hypothetical protein